MFDQITIHSDNDTEIALSDSDSQLSNHETYLFWTDSIHSTWLTTNRKDVDMQLDRMFEWNIQFR